ncbi:polysaccharide pyruvyl transferase family protein [Nitrosococcus wardiae]|uniref:Polysaccharide pyruvyl transferase n=1 Tax=Nitrosococcus wardiae TaxID=1814290 RepID=A0A4P7BY54_9GAMM|nr:polysaccharide pyruvyl transferase family protein [Nitrosococcus wardiae]QBQ54080.1 polysaccharide pyruvyl transferase [Nitrosococcus wardiae]
MFKVGISGSYGGLNLGDEAILQVMVSELRRTVPVEITVFSRDPEDTLKRQKVERAIPVRKLSRDEVLPEIQRLDLFLLGGGGILFDAEAKIYLREVALAHELGVPVMVYAVSAGPLHDPSAQKLVRDNLNQAAIVTVREKKARYLLEEVGVYREIIVTADPALLAVPEPLAGGALKNEGLAGRHRIVGMSVREPGVAAPDIDQKVYHALLANAADFMVDRFDADVVFIPMERQVLDVQHAHAVIAQMLRAPRATVLKGEYTPGQMLSLMSYFSFAVGMRLHFLIFAALQGIPFVALPYSSKVGGFLEDLDIETPPFKLVNAGRLIAHLDQSWDRRRSLQARIRRALPSLKSRAEENNTLATQLLVEKARSKTSQSALAPPNEDN